jgi:hypothetical protein
VQQLLHHVHQRPSAAAGAAAAAGGAQAAVAAVPPFPVLVHYVKVLVDALQGLLLKPPQGTIQAGVMFFPFIPLQNDQICLPLTACANLEDTCIPIHCLLPLKPLKMCRHVRACCQT